MIRDATVEAALSKMFAPQPLCASAHAVLFSTSRVLTEALEGADTFVGQCWLMCALPEIRYPGPTAAPETSSEKLGLRAEVSRMLDFDWPSDDEVIPFAEHVSCHEVFVEMHSGAVEHLGHTVRSLARSADSETISRLCRRAAEWAVNELTPLESASPYWGSHLVNETLGKIDEVERAGLEEVRAAEWKRGQDDELRAIRDRARERLSALEAEVDKLGTLASPAPEAVRWSGTQEQLAYLLFQLREHGFIDEPHLWSLAERAFVRVDGRPFARTSIKSAASKLGIGTGGASSTRAADLDSLVDRVLGLTD